MKVKDLIEQLQRLPEDYDINHGEYYIENIIVCITDKTGNAIKDSIKQYRNIYDNSTRVNISDLLDAELKYLIDNYKHKIYII